MKKWLILLLFVGIFVLIGCQPSQPEIITSPGSQLLVKTIVKSDWLVTVSIIGIGAAFFAFLNGYKNSINILAACLIVLGTYLMIAKYGVLIAVLAMIGSVSLLAYTIFIKHKALKEIIQGIQNVKRLDTPEKKDDVNNTLSNSQTETTKEVVKKIKDK